MYKETTTIKIKLKSYGLKRDLWLITSLIYNKYCLGFVKGKLYYIIKW